LDIVFFMSQIFYSMVISDTTPPPAPPASRADVMDPEFKSLMGEMAVMFPKLPEPLQEQARHAHGHVQSLIANGHRDQALNLMKHMRDVMSEVVGGSHALSAPPFIPGVPDSPLPVNLTRNVFYSTADSPPIVSNIEAASPPPHTTDESEISALKRTVEDLQMKMSGNSAVTLIAKRVRDIEMDQRYSTLETQIREMRHLVEARLDKIRGLIDKSETYARIEAKKRTVSRNPFCEHGPAGECDFCVGKEFEDADFLISNRAVDSGVIIPPRTTGAMSEELVNREMILSMQNTLKSYQGMLKDLLEERKKELHIDRERNVSTR
jgi:hypothetical protein